MYSGEKSEAKDELDRISALPLHLRESILELLPIKDAMRTSVWSSSWRYCWIGMIRFDLEAMGPDVDVEVFRKTIDRILLLHPGRIHSLTFSIPQTWNIMDFNLSDWFLGLSKKGIHHITAIGLDAPNPITLPDTLFQCCDLSYLELSNFNITSPLPNFTGFKLLLDLVIVKCTIPSDTLWSLISNCPLLEGLWLCHTCRQYRNQPPLVIDAANLTELFFADDLLGTIILQNVPKLSFARFEIPDSDATEHDRPCISWDFICSLSGISELRFDLLLFGPVIGKWPRCLPMRLENLTVLALYSVSAVVEDDLRLVFCFLRSSPCLQLLRILFENVKTTLLPEPERSMEDAVKLLEMELRESSKLSNLSNIEFKGISWLGHEVMLMKVLLSRCSNLKSLRIIEDGVELADDFIDQISWEFREIHNVDKLFFH